jgi:hypothetical protein
MREKVYISERCRPWREVGPHWRTPMYLPISIRDNAGATKTSVRWALTKTYIWPCRGCFFAPLLKTHYEHNETSLHPIHDVHRPHARPREQGSIHRVCHHYLLWTRVRSQGFRLHVSSLIMPVAPCSLGTIRVSLEDSSTVPRSWLDSLRSQTATRHSKGSP